MAPQRRCRCEELQRKCPSCKNVTYRQNLKARKADQQLLRLPRPVRTPIPQSTPHLRPILPAPVPVNDHSQAIACSIVLQQAINLLAAAGRAVDPEEFRAGRCTYRVKRGGESCGQLANITRPRCHAHTAVVEGIEVRLSGMGVGFGAIASQLYEHRDGPVVFTTGSTICEVHSCCFS